MTAREEISQQNLQEHVKFLSGFEKLSGTAGAHKAAAYMAEQLEKDHVPYEILKFQEYVSDPLASTIQLPDGTVVRSRPRSFSLCLPQGVSAPLVYDDCHVNKAVTLAEKAARLDSYAGKIVLSHGYDERYAKLLEQHGALGWIQIWSSDEEQIHEDTVSSIWGTPDLDTSLLQLRIPVLAVNHADGEFLARYAARPGAAVFIAATVDTGVRTVEVPVAYIPGQTEDFVLLSGHYDTWYAGAYDNITANAACLELARVFTGQPKPLRGIRIAWWAGHSNGRYAGSNWYYDHHYTELADHCTAQINSDMISSLTGSELAVITTGLEGETFMTNLLRQVDAAIPIHFKRFGRGADQSFWGAEIPYNLMTRYEAAREDRRSDAPGGNPWWHTIEDTYDKINMELLTKGTKVLYETVNAFASLPVLPMDLGNYFKKMEGRLQQVDAHSDSIFDFKDIYQALKQVEQAALAVANNGTIAKTNKLAKLVGGKYNWLMQTYGSRFGQDLSYAYGMFPHLTAVEGVYQETTEPAEFLFYRTEFQRQKNRFLYESRRLERELRNLR